jgi:uncharacterized protein
MNFTPLPIAIPDLDRLVETVYARSTHHHSQIHGPQHWQAVGRVGLDLIRAGEPANPAVVFAFALLHDSQRLNDDYDPQHGPRAAATIPGLIGTHLHLTDIETRLLTQACATHTEAQSAADPTVAVCLDADRLNLWRVGIWPDPRYLSTTSARDQQRIDDSCDRCFESTDWRDLYDAYCELPQSACGVS